MLTYPDGGVVTLSGASMLYHTHKLFGSGHQHITSWDPLHVGAEVEDHRLRAAFDIVQMQLEEEEVDTQLRKSVGVFPSDHFLMGKCGELTSQGTC